ncbi:malA [Symbiodinium sp. CCMP2592]|nr:malA [Symbiodinium sp. CCMP2592]
MASEHTAIPAHPSILLLNSRPWLYDLQVSRLKDVTDEQLTTALLGGSVDVCWLQGCWELGPYGRQHDLSDPTRRQHFQDCLPDFSEADCIGSPYAISRYTCNPHLGTEEDLAEFRARLASQGVALMLDFVPNHMARDSPWIDIPDLFIRGRDGKVAFGKDPYSGDWTDTAQLNYWSTACRDHMLQQLMDVAERCDGMRVDMAMLCVNDVIERTWGHHLREQGFHRPGEEFWVWALPRLRARHPNFLLVAECYEYDEILPSGTMRELLRQGFSAAYDKVLYDRLTEGHMDKLRGHILHSPDMATGRLCHFTENHDEDRAAAHYGPRSLAATVASLSLPGPRLLMWGQALGLRARLAVHLRRARQEAPDSALSAIWPRLLAALPHCRGSWQASLPVHGDDSWRFLAWGWKPDGEAAKSEVVACIVVVNFTDSAGWATLKLGALLPGSPRSDSLALKDAIGGETFRRSCSALNNEGLVVGLQPYQSHLLLCSFQ